MTPYPCGRYIMQGTYKQSEKAKKKNGSISNRARDCGPDFLATTLFLVERAAALLAGRAGRPQTRAYARRYAQIRTCARKYAQLRVQIRADARRYAQLRAYTRRSQ